jgi:adenylate cyclase
MTLFREGGPRTEKLLRHLRLRARAAPTRRARLDARIREALFRPRAVVFTDTSDFTVRTARDGILHCLMLFARLAVEARTAIRRCGGDILKMEGDSWLLRFDDAEAACRGVVALETAIARANRGRPESERLHFSYGIGYGEVLDLESDMYGLEVNLASKIGTELARPGEVLMTPAAAAALDRKTLRRVVPHHIMTFESAAVPVQRLRLPRR